LTGGQWLEVEPVLTAWRAARVGLGIAPIKRDLREIVNAILYVNRTGVRWEFLSHDLPPGKAVFDYYTK
jgi:transposase